MSLREAAEKALGWMESAWYKINGEWDPLERSPDDEPEITNLRDALLEAEAPKAEPDGWIVCIGRIPEDVFETRHDAQQFVDMYWNTSDSRIVPFYYAEEARTVLAHGRKG